MTVSANPVLRYQFTGDGATTVFPYPDPVHGDAELTVISTDTLTSIDTTMVLNVDYTISGLPLGGPYPSGVNVTIVPAPLATDVITIIRDTTIDQTQSFITASAFPAVIMEQVLDKLVLILQELLNSIGFFLQFPASFPGTPIPTLPLPLAGRPLVWNVAEDGLENGPDLSGIGSIAADVAAAQAAAVAAAASAAAASASAAAAAAAAASVPTPQTDSVTTVDATPTTLATLTTTSNRAISLVAEILSRNTGTGSAAFHKRHVLAKNVAGVVTILEESDSVTLEEVPALDVSFVVSGTDILLQVTGIAATTINWRSETFKDELA